MRNCGNKIIICLWCRVVPSANLYHYQASTQPHTIARLDINLANSNLIGTALVEHIMCVWSPINWWFWCVTPQCENIQGDFANEHEIYNTLLYSLLVMDQRLSSGNF